jgi:hypothetical protein
MLKPKIESAIGISTKWNAIEAGREVAKMVLSRMKNTPNFVLLYSTIHYKNNGGFQNLLNGIWEILPEKTALIGGTVSGFINNYGCYTHGVTAIAISYKNMDIATGIGSNTKRNPKLAAKICSKKIKKKLKNSKYNNKFLINSISGPTIPKIPFLGRVNIIKSKAVGLLFSYIAMPITEFLGYGIGKEGDIVDKIGKEMKEFHIIGGSTMDDGKQISCFQFCGNKVYRNSIIALGVCTDLPIFLKGAINLKETNKSFKITKSIFGKRIITKIEGKPAKKRFIEVMGFSDQLYKDLGAFYYKTANYFPISFEGNREFVSGIGAFLGENILLGYKARGDNVVILSVSGRDSLDTIDEIFTKDYDKLLPFVFMPASGIRFINMVGDKTYDIKKRLDKYLGNIPYLLIGTVNENIGFPNQDTFSRVYSINALSFDNNEIKYNELKAFLDSSTN